MQSKSQIQSIGIDLGKTTFHLVALGSSAASASRKGQPACVGRGRRFWKMRRRN